MKFELETDKPQEVVSQMLAEQKQQQDEWEWRMKQDKIEQNHDFMGERNNQENEEE